MPDENVDAIVKIPSASTGSDKSDHITGKIPFQNTKPSPSSPDGDDHGDTSHDPLEWFPDRPEHSLEEWDAANAETDRWLASPEHREVEITDYIEAVSSDMINLMPRGKTRDEITSLNETVLYLAKKLKLTGEVCNYEEALNWEKGALLFALAKRWNNAIDLTAKKRVASQISALFDDTERDYVLVDNRDEGWGFPRHGLIEIIRELWPESDGNPDWIKENKAIDKMVVLPSKRREEMYRLVCDRLEVPMDKRIRFGGVAVYPWKLVFIWDDSGARARAHERRHLNPGLRLGMLGSAINEGVTEWGAVLEVGDEMDKAIKSFSLKELSEYCGELKLLKMLYGDNYGLEELMEKRYINGDLEASQKLAASLIGRYGIDGYLDLYLIRPFVHELGDKNKVGFISPREFMSKYMEKK